MGLFEFNIDTTKLVKGYLGSKDFRDHVTEIEFNNRLYEIDEYCRIILDAAVEGVGRYDNTYLNPEAWAEQFNSQTLSFTPPNYHNRSGNLKASYCFGVYFKKTLRDYGFYYDGRTINYKDYYTINDGDLLETDLDGKNGREMAIEFLKNYKQSNNSICEIVFAAAVPYAKLLEKGETWGKTGSKNNRYDVITYAEEYALEIGGIKRSRVF